MEASVTEARRMPARTATLRTGASRTRVPNAEGEARRAIARGSDARFQQGLVGPLVVGAAELLREHVVERSR